ncbi:HAD family hydrolase [Shimia sp.]|uniref:HAD family hydrolase n=1 Tax=Shimia sp. TaxID=1954381 RepID=UPI003B8B50DE
MSLFQVTPDAYLFDMDGLLLDTERMFCKAFVELTAELGIENRAASSFFATLVGTSSKVTTARLSDFLPKGTDIADFDVRWRTLHSDNVQKGVPVKPHVFDVLQAIEAKGVPMAVVTSSSAKAASHHLDHAGLLPFFETVCAGDEVSKNKPDPEPYLTGAARLGASASRCVAFEDSDLGTTAAVRAGCKTVQVPDLRPVGTPLPDLGQIVADSLGHAAVQIGLFDGPLT